METTKLKALTVCQPWAWLILDGRKAVENRGWRTNYRGPLVIHAGLDRSWLERMEPEFRDARIYRGVPEAGEEGLYEKDRAGVMEALHFGGFVGLVDLVDVLPLDQAPPSPFASGPYCWVLENPRPFARMIRGPGQPGLFEVTREKIREGLELVGVS